MIRVPWIAIPVLAAGVLFAPPAGAQDTRDARAELADLLLAESTTRGQMAEEALRALEVVEFQPPDCVPGEETFTDVPADSPFCPWIEELVRRGITVGCGGGRYCPHDLHSRQQMAVFLVRGIEAAIEEVPEGPPGPPGPEGPVGPEGPPGPPGFAGNCNAGLAPDDEMVRVGSVCIDRYEASIWTEPEGGVQLTTEAEIDALCPDNGQDCKDMIFARSVAGVEPASNITWFQAQQALANSGKRLPTNAEWQMAASGTPDHPGPCNTGSDSVQNTGANAGCISDWGVNDMVGNLTEWVADWGDDATTCTLWSSTFGDDLSCVGLGEGEVNSHFPGALIRGGSFFNSSIAGPFAVDGSGRPSESGASIGFRGAR